MPCESVNDHVVIEMLNALAAVVAGALAKVVVGFVIGAAWPLRPRPAAATAAGDRSFKELILMGDPLSCSQGIRTPHMCGIARLRVFPRRRMRQLRRVFRHLARQPSARSAPRGPARHFAPRPGAPPRRGVPRPARSPAPAAPWPSVVCPRPRATANVAYRAFAMRRPPMLRCRSEALFSTIRCHHTPGSSSRQSRLWRR